MNTKNRKTGKYPGFWAVMPNKTRVAFIAFLFGKFFFCPLALVGMFVDNRLSIFAFIAWGACIIVVLVFALIEMFGQKRVPTRLEVKEWMKYHDIKQAG